MVDLRLIWIEKLRKCWAKFKKFAFRVQKKGVAVIVKNLDDNSASDLEEGFDNYEQNRKEICSFTQ